MRRGALLDLTLKNKEGLFGDGKVEGRFGCRDHEMVEFRILRGGSKAKRKTTALDSKRAVFDLFKDLLGRPLWEMVVERSLGELTEFSRITYSKLRNGSPVYVGNQAKVTEGCMDAQGAPKKTYKGREMTWEEYKEII